MESFMVQSWTLFALSVSIIFARLILRRIMLKRFKGLQSDDWIMVFVMLPLAAFCVLATSVKERKLVEPITNLYVLEELRIVITWSIKACLLVLYWRIFPVAFSTQRRRYIQIASAICALSFITIQISLLFGCHPNHRSYSQCSMYYGYAIVSLTCTALTTVVVLVVPIPFIPTPRRLLLTILIMTGITILILGIVPRIYILTDSTSQEYLLYYIYEITLLILFANLPFLTSLFVTTTPARLRKLGRHFSGSCEAVHLPLSPWPRSRRASIHYIEAAAPLTESHSGSTVTTTSERVAAKETTVYSPVMRPASVKYDPEAERRSHSGQDWPLPSQEALK